jgi:hypothetical protein
MNDFARERLEINEDMRTRTRVVYTAADQFNPLFNKTKRNHCLVTYERNQ